MKDLLAKLLAEAYTLEKPDMTKEEANAYLRYTTGFDMTSSTIESDEDFDKKQREWAESVVEDYPEYFDDDVDLFDKEHIDKTLNDAGEIMQNKQMTDAFNYGMSHNDWMEYVESIAIRRE